MRPDTSIPAGPVPMQGHLEHGVRHQLGNRLDLYLRLIHCLFPSRPSRLRGEKVNRLDTLRGTRSCSRRTSVDRPYWSVAVRRMKSVKSSNFGSLRVERFTAKAQERQENRRTRSSPIDHPLHAVLDQRNASVRVEAKSRCRELQVRQQLGFVNGGHCLNRLVLDDDALGHEHVDAA